MKYKVVLQTGETLVIEDVYKVEMEGSFVALTHYERGRLLVVAERNLRLLEQIKDGTR